MSEKRDEKRLEKESAKIKKTAEKSEDRTASAATAIIGILGGTILLAPDILNLDVRFSPGENAFNWQPLLGAALLIIGLIAGFYWLKSKKR